MNKYLVISYDTDQQQWFYDVVFAPSEDKAGEKIAKLRPYVVDADVLDMATLSRMTERVMSETKAESDAWMRELAAEARAL